MSLFDVIGGALGGSAGLVTGGLGLIGGTVADVMNTNSTNQANKDQSQAQMAFQERMSNSAYQRVVKDMRSAGLNPMLAYQQGGASTPTGASAQIQKSNIGENLGKLSTNALNAATVGSQLEKNASEVQLNKSQEKTQETQALLNLANAKSSTANSAKASTETQILQKELPRAKMRSDVEGGLYDLIKKSFRIPFSAKDTDSAIEDAKKGVLKLR